MSNMPKRYLLADTNSLVYAYRAGGIELLETYRRMASAEKRKLAITTTVADEIEKGPLKQELGRYIADRGLPVLETPKLEQKLETGQVTAKNAGEYSMLEVAAEEHTKGRTTRIWSDDKYFASQQNLRRTPWAEPVTSAEMLNQAYERRRINTATYEAHRASYEALSEFRPGQSPRLNTFGPSSPTLLERVGASDAAIAAKPGFQALARVGGAAGVGLMAYDAATTTHQYNALTARGNQFGADALLHEYVGRTGGGLAAGFAAGAAYGAATGSWSGPGALVTGAVGGTIGAFGGEAIGRAYTEYRMDHQLGDDGHSYVHRQGRWEQSHWLQKNQPAPADQIGTLEYKRTSAITELALARPQQLDTQHITLQGPQGQKVDYRRAKDGWVTEVIDQGPHGTAIPVGDFGAVLTHPERADPTVGKQLDQIAALRRDANAHYSENLAKAYLTDYVGRGLARDDRPVPESVTKALNLPSEIHLQDPATGQTWERSPKGTFTRTEQVELAGLEGKEFVSRTLTAKGPEMERLSQVHQGHVQTNRQYGAALVTQKFQEMQQPQRTSQQPSQPSQPSQPTHPMTPHGTPASKSGAALPAHAAVPSTTSRPPEPIPPIITHEKRITPTPGGMSFHEAHKRRDEPEQISPGSLQAVGKLDESKMVKGSMLYRMHQANEQDLMRSLRLAQAQDRERFKDEPSPQRPSLERTQERTQERAQEQAPRRLLEETPVQQQAEARPAVPSVSAAQPAASIREEHVAAPLAHTLSPGHANAAPAVVPNLQGVAPEQRAQAPSPSLSQPVADPAAAALIAAAQAQNAASQAQMAELQQRMARLEAQGNARDERERSEATRVAQGRDTGQHPEAAAQDKQASATATATASPPLRDFSDPSHPQNALYSILKDRLPQGTSEKRLVQSTAACHLSQITAKDLSGIYIGDNAVLFVSKSIHVAPAEIDISRPAPDIQQTLQEVQQYDQQRAQRMSEMEARNAAQANQQQQGPVMG